MAARDHHHRTVPDLTIVEHDAHGSEIVVGVRLKAQSWCRSTGAPYPADFMLSLPVSNRAVPHRSCKTSTIRG
jgi:hypothetical protein